MVPVPTNLVAMDHSTAECFKKSLMQNFDIKPLQVFESLFLNVDVRRFVKSNG